MAMRGAVEVPSYAPSALPQPNEDLMLRLEQLYANDAQLHTLWSAALEAHSMAGGMGGGRNRQKSRRAWPHGGKLPGKGGRPAHRDDRDQRLGHAQRAEQPPRRPARGLDGLVGGMRQGMGAAWEQTVALVATEFGRTAAANGTGGTDHGTGAAAMLLGGAVQGGRVIADWPGLAPADLLDGRDLRPTLALDALIAQACAEVFKADPAQLRRVLFPDAPAHTPLARLLRA
jgi:uncharacterized protein (DUF1501 family)